LMQHVAAAGVVGGLEEAEGPFGLQGRLQQHR
jgi:hypothetical protein